MNYNGRNNYSRRKYSEKHYKRLVIEDKPQKEQERNSKKERVAAARDEIVRESGYSEGIQKYMSSRKKQAKRAKRSKFFGFGKKASAAALIVAAIIIGSIIIFPTQVNAEIVSGYEVILNGTVLGVSESIEPVSNALNNIQAEFSQDYGMNIFDSTELSFNPVKIDKQFLCPEEEFIKILKKSVDVKVMAWVILVNNAPAAAVKTQAEAQSALDRVLSPFMEEFTNDSRLEVGFVELVEVVEMPIEYSQVTDEDAAYKLLRFGGDFEERYHIVVSGESLYAISKNYNVTIADLRKANPSLASTNKIYPGDRLLITTPMNRVNVKFVEEIDKVGEVIPYETQLIENDSMLVTEKVLVQAGVDGIHDVHALVTYINGVETEVEILSESNRIDPIPEIIQRGTKEVPRIMELAATGGMPIPLESGTYRISSPFGPRNTGIPGASTFHGGVDLAANKGTPIYASASGTVTHSGSGTGYGLYIKIDHGNGVETRYAHCSELLVDKGDKVKAGELIGLVGNTGISSGSHLHWEVRLNGVKQDPMGEYQGVVP